MKRLRRNCDPCGFGFRTHCAAGKAMEPLRGGCPLCVWFAMNVPRRRADVTWVLVWVMEVWMDLPVSYLCFGQARPVRRRQELVTDAQFQQHLLNQPIEKFSAVVSFEGLLNSSTRCNYLFPTCIRKSEWHMECPTFSVVTQLDVLYFLATLEL